jgi:hypothetical protein
MLHVLHDDGRNLGGAGGWPQRPVIGAVGGLTETLRNSALHSDQTDREAPSFIVPQIDIVGHVRDKAYQRRFCGSLNISDSSLS